MPTRTHYQTLMDATEHFVNIRMALSTDQMQALGMAVIAQQLSALNTNIELLTETIRNLPGPPPMGADNCNFKRGG